MVNTENLRKWVAALRSGEYEQTQGALRRDGADAVGYCCLGVACDISGLGRWTDGDEDDTYEYGSSAMAYVIDGFESDRSAAVLPLPVVRWLGLPDPLDGNPDVHNEEGYTFPLAYFNDTEGLSFDEIADLIEKEFLA